MEPDKICAALRRLAAKTVPGGGGSSPPSFSPREKRLLLEAADIIERAYGLSRSGGERGLRLVVSIDGAARGNPGPAGIGVLLQEENGRLEQEFSKYIGETTNNVAEYEALLLALGEVGRLKPAKVRVRSDSELLVRQVEGTYRVKSPHLAVLHSRALQLIRTIPSFEIEHVRRELNREADALANRAIDEAFSRLGRDGGRT